VDEEGLPLVYNEARIAAFWSKRPGELASRWTRFAAISGEQQQAAEVAVAWWWRQQQQRYVSSWCAVMWVSFAGGVRVPAGTFRDQSDNSNGVNWAATCRHLRGSSI
jgi:hypothetical protein